MMSDVPARTSTAEADDFLDVTLLSVAEVARIFNRTERTIRQWVQRDYLRPVRIGRSLFFLESEVHRLIADGLRRSALPHA